MRQHKGGYNIDGWVYRDGCYILESDAAIIDQRRKDGGDYIWINEANGISMFDYQMITGSSQGYFMYSTWMNNSHAYKRFVTEVILNGNDIELKPSTFPPVVAFSNYRVINCCHTAIYKKAKA
jgi:hypothetical protein